MSNIITRDLYLIDFTSRLPEVMRYPPEFQKEDLKFFKVKSCLEIQDFDQKFFESMDEAERYLQEYKYTLKNLKSLAVCKEKNIPCLLYKRRFLVQTILGTKLHTFRDSATVINRMSKLKSGDLFNLTDQTHMLTVKLKKASKTKNGMRYDFELLK